MKKIQVKESNIKKIIYDTFTHFAKQTHKQLEVTLYISLNFLNYQI